MSRKRIAAMYHLKLIARRFSHCHMNCSMSIDQDSSNAKRQGREKAGWLLMLLLGFVVFELTADAKLALLVACVKFGWNDWLTARWFQKSDPIPARGLACARFYRASAVWKVGAAAVGGMFVVSTAHVAAKGGNQLPIEFKLVTYEACVAFGLAGLLTAVATFVAWRSGHRVWVDKAGRRWREQNLWPPGGQIRGNAAGSFLAYAITAWLAPLDVAIAVVVLPPINPQNPAPPLDNWRFLVWCGVVFASVMFGFETLKFLIRRVVARSPFECWPEMVYSNLEECDEPS